MPDKGIFSFDGKKVHRLRARVITIFKMNKFLSLNPVCTAFLASKKTANHFF